MRIKMIFLLGCFSCSLVVQGQSLETAWKKLNEYHDEVLEGSASAKAKAELKDAVIELYKKKLFGVIPNRPNEIIFSLESYQHKASVYLSSECNLTSDFQSQTLNHQATDAPSITEPTSVPITFQKEKDGLNSSMKKLTRKNVEIGNRQMEENFKNLTPLLSLFESNENLSINLKKFHDSQSAQFAQLADELLKLRVHQCESYRAELLAQVIYNYLELKVMFARYASRED